MFQAVLILVAKVSQVKEKSFNLIYLKKAKSKGGPDFIFLKFWPVMIVLIIK